MDQTTFEEVPPGWRDLVETLFDGIAAAMARHPGRHLALRQVKEKFGGLRIYLGPVADADGTWPEVPDTVRTLLAGAERRSFLTCDRCGGPGCLRVRTGWYATRCDPCAEAGSTPVCDGVDGEQEAAPSDLDAAPPPEPTGQADRVAARLPAAAAKPVRPEPDWRAALAAGPAPEPDGAAPVRRVALYALDDVAAAAGRGPNWADGHDTDGAGEADERDTAARRSADSEHLARLQDILASGERGRWRDLVGVVPGALAALDELGRSAPHLDAMTGLVRRHLRAAAAIGLSVTLPPVLLLGPPGVGKSWYLARLATALQLPFRTYPMNVSTLGEGLTGSHPSWRNSGPGLVAKTLLRERVANPIVLVDEFDKAQANGWARDPYAPFYSLLDPSNARAFTDEYLQFPIDASGVSWVLAGNDASLLPEPILDRLTVLIVPTMSTAQLAAVCQSIYAEANAARLGFFDPEPDARVVEALLGLNPRAIRVVIEDAMVSAAADERRTVTPDDLRPRGRSTARRIGF